MADLIVEQIRKEYPTPSGPLRILDGVSISLSRGENIAIVGPSGSGKSTLLHILGTLEKPTSGMVRLDGQDPFALQEKQLAQFRNRQIGFVFQDHHLLPQLTALENVLVPALADGKADQQEIGHARDLLERVGLSGRASHRPAELSGGERQRVAIARALLFQPALILADEPTGNLDRGNSQAVADLLVDLQTNSRPEKIMIVVTHSDGLARRMQNCAELNGGRIGQISPQPSGN